MKRCGLPIMVFCLATLACKEDPARSVKITAHPLLPASTEPTPSGVPVKPAPQPLPTVARAKSLTQSTKITHPRLPASAAAKSSSVVPDPSRRVDNCPPPAENSQGPGNLVANGPCEFEHTALVSCEASKDDFYAAFTREARNGATLVTYINVEHYNGPGDYDGAQMFVALQSGTSIIRWSNDNVRATVGPGEAYVSFPITRLEAEPTLVDCTRLIGPKTNYQYQCSVRTGGEIAIDRVAEIVSGKLQCGDRQKMNGGQSSSFPQN